MRVCVIAILCLVLAATAASARTVPRDVSVAPPLCGDSGDLPSVVPSGFGRADTLDFGYYTVIGGTYYAVLGETWTWDHSPGPGPVYNTEGWQAVDETDNGADYFRRITAAEWDGHGNQVPAPIGNGLASVWCGAFEDRADTLCWSNGLGYGNRWCQRLISPPFEYSGNGDVTMQFVYFNDSERNWDYSKVYVIAGDAEPFLLNPPGFDGRIGVQSPPNLPVYQAYSRVVTGDELGGTGVPENIRFYFEFKSDGGWSDEDGGYATSYGPFGVDDISVTGPVTPEASYDFESGLQGWTADHCPPIGSFFSIQPVSRYNIQDPCHCPISGYVAAFHDENEEHPRGQFVSAYSPPVRKSVEAPYPAYNAILADWDMYAELPQANAVFYRPAWSYYPYLCLGITQWSEPRGQPGWQYVGEMPSCFRTRNIATNWAIPPDCEDIRFVFQVHSSCEDFNVYPCPPVSQTNFTPIIDNVCIRMTRIPVAPVVSYDVGMYFSDNFNQGPVLDPMGVGNADVVYDLHRDPPPDMPDRLGDSLGVSGPILTPSTRFLTRLWFRVKREGPGQVHIARYRAWKARVSDGVNIVGETSPNHGRNFAFGWMDSVEVGTRVSYNKFCTQFHEMDDDFTAPEQGEDNEIIWDNMLTPGTKIEYFVSSNYICTPNENYLRPDTTGGACLEFEILPGYRNVVGGLYRYPCVLYVDAFQDRTARVRIEGALNVVLNHGAIGDRVPDPTSWDRYDYKDACSCWGAPMFRNTGGNSGGTLAQFLGYRFIMVDTGTIPEGTMHDRDWMGFRDWLTSGDCFGTPQPRQGFWASGDDIAQIINSSSDSGYPPFLHDNLGAAYNCGAYHDSGCPTTEDPTRNDDLYCTKLRPNPGGAWTPAFDLEAWGNWCPTDFVFDALAAYGSGTGNKSYQRKSDDYFAPDRYAQVTNDYSGAEENYRTVINGYGLSHIIRPDLGQGIPGECLADNARIIEAIAEETQGVMQWTLGLDPSTLAELCVDPCVVIGPPSGAPIPDTIVRVNRLYPSSPNPFNPRATLRFSLAAAGPVRLVVCDVSGRIVRTLVDRSLTAGMHEEVWDGTDDAGHRLASGIYWSRLHAPGYVSSMKLTILR